MLKGKELLLFDTVLRLIDKVVSFQVAFACKLAWNEGVMFRTKLVLRNVQVTTIVASYSFSENTPTRG